MDHHTVAAVSITGTCLDVLGSLYLAYDLLGGQHGPLRLLTRAVAYSIVFGIGYGLGLGLFFGLASGIATGITLSIEFNRAARGLHRHGPFLGRLPNRQKLLACTSLPQNENCRVCGSHFTDLGHTFMTRC
jgi:hypothetical protein